MGLGLKGDRVAKLPQQPDMGKLLQPHNRVGIPIFGFKNNPALQFFHQSALPGDSEFFIKIRFYSGNDLHLYTSSPSR